MRDSFIKFTSCTSKVRLLLNIVPYNRSYFLACWLVLTYNQLGGRRSNSRFCFLCYHRDSKLPCVCSVIDHRRRYNVLRTSVTHSAIASCAIFCRTVAALVNCYILFGHYSYIDLFFASFLITAGKDARHLYGIYSVKMTITEQTFETCFSNLESLALFLKISHVFTNWSYTTRSVPPLWEWHIHILDDTPKGNVRNHYLHETVNEWTPNVRDSRWTNYKVARKKVI